MKLEELIKHGNVEELFENLEENKNNIIVVEPLLEEITRRLNNREFEFNSKDTNYIYLYMFLCNKYEKTEYLDKLINNIEFIKVLDGTKIDGGILPSLTDVCTKPRKSLLLNSKKLKDSIIRGDKLLSTKDIIDDLTTEEITILREDFEVDNYLINKGISFDTLKPETVERLLSDVSFFRIYDIDTINEFANAYPNKKELVNNDIFLDIYISKLTDEYHYDNKLFEYLDVNTIIYLLSKDLPDHVLLHLAKDTIKEVQQEVLKDERVLVLLHSCHNEDILSKIPTNLLYDILVKRNNIFKGTNLKMLETLSKKLLESLALENPFYYPELLEIILNGNDFNISIFIEALPNQHIKDLSQRQITNFNLKSLTNLLKVNTDLFKPTILKSIQLCNDLIGNVTTRTYKTLEEFLNAGKFSVEEKVKLLTNLISIKDTKVLNKLVESIPLANRRNLYNSELIRKELLNEEQYELDEYTINHLLNNLEELKNQSSKVIITILKNADLAFAQKVINDDFVIEKIFKEKDAIDNIISILDAKKYLTTAFCNKKLFKLYNRDNIKEIFNHLSIKERNNLCTNELVRQLLNNDEETFAIYKKLCNKNKYLLNTLDFNFLCLPNIKDVKLSNLELITKYPSIQENIIRISKHLNILPNFINSLFYNTPELDFVTTVNECLSLLKDSCEGTNRKYIGNIPKMLGILNFEELSKEDLKYLITYLLYLIPRFHKHEGERVERPIILKTPSTLNEIKTYEQATEERLTILINTCLPNEVKKYFVAKHFKLSLEEAEIILNTYSIDRIDDSIYKVEYEFLSSLNKVMNTDPVSLKEMDYGYKTITIYDSFAIEKLIKEMYGKIYNYEIRSKSYINNPFEKTLYGKEIKMYNCPNDFFFLASNLDISEELELTNSYLEAWHNTVNKLPNGVHTSLISNDNLTLKDDLVFGFNGILDEGIKKMSSYNICINCLNKTKERYMTPRELIDNTRDITNTIVIDRYAVRPNYNNSNIPNIEPDFILADATKIEDNNYLEKVVRASEEFKTKRNRDGLPIIVVDTNKIVENEQSKINGLMTKYEKSHDLSTLVSLLTKIENNYTSYRNTDIHTAERFDIINLLTILKNRISKSNSISELDYIDDILTNEANKFNILTNDLECNYNLKELKILITQRKEIIK